jgi:S-adenosylmethionine uptake transporter
MLLASLFFACMGVCIKFASEHFNSFEIVCYRVWWVCFFSTP